MKEAKIIAGGVTLILVTILIATIYLGMIFTNLNVNEQPTSIVSIPFMSHTFIGDSNEVLEYAFNETIIVDGRHKQVDCITIPVYFVVYQPYYEWVEEPDCYRFFPPCGYNTVAYREFNLDGYEYIYNRLELIFNNISYKVSSNYTILLDDNNLLPINDVVSIPMNFRFAIPPYASGFPYKFELLVGIIGGQG